MIIWNSLIFSFSHCSCCVALLILWRSKIDVNVFFWLDVWDGLIRVFGFSAFDSGRVSNAMDLLFTFLQNNHGIYHAEKDYKNRRNQLDSSKKTIFAGQNPTATLLQMHHWPANGPILMIGPRLFSRRETLKIIF